eukprot:764404-Hanusia_phi.AAC.2
MWKWQHYIPNDEYVACPKDNSLASLLLEAFKLLELRFTSYDADGAETLMYFELERKLAMAGFVESEKLQALFKRVDLDGNGTLDFSEFLCLLYLWVDQGNYSCFFRNPQNAQIISKAFMLMEQAMIRYDVDRNRTLSINELNAFFADHIPVAVQSGVYKAVVDNVYPETHRQSSELGFPKFMYLLYDVMCKYPGSSLKGTYSRTGLKSTRSFSSGDTGENSKFWRELNAAYNVLEQDFNHFDTNKDHVVDYDEITRGFPAARTAQEKVNILSRLEYAYSQVDLDGSGSLDFFEFVYLSFMMTQNGSYHDLVEDTTGAQKVKKAFIDIHSFYRKYDTDKNLRLTLDEVQNFCRDLFGVVPDQVPSLFASIAYKSSATQGRDALDVVRFMKFLYTLTCPTGQFNPNNYNPAKRVIQPSLISIPVAKQDTRPPRIQHVVPAKFSKGKLLGQGGQGTVHLGSYDGMSCAGKTLLGQPDAGTVQETIDEVDFFLKLDHPNCHYLLGAKTTLENGGILILTELCDLGSIYDFYSKGRKKFDSATALRLAEECATGFEVIHSLGYMHRDIKSLNVFLTKDLVAKVADFGMCTPQPLATDACGTPQWMAPEVISNLLGMAKEYDRTVDVFSYAILLWELYHCSTPYMETRLDQMGICKNVFHRNIRE